MLKLPAVTFPAAPFADPPPAGWTRTAFTEAGIHEFTPHPDTTFLYIVAQGAGGGGFIDVGNNLGTASNGEDTLVTNSQGHILAKGFGGFAATKAAVGVANASTHLREGGWLNDPVFANGNAAGARNAHTNPAQGAGANAPFLTNGGKSFSAPALGSRTFLYDFQYSDRFNNTIEFAGNWTYQDFTDHAGVTKKRWRSIGIGNNSTSTMTITRTIPANTLVKFGWGVGCAFDDFLCIDVDGLNKFSVSGDETGVFEFLAPSSKSYVFSFRYVKGSVNNSAGLKDAAWVDFAILPSAYIYPIGSGGGSGTNMRGAYLPEPLTINIGKGGIGNDNGLDFIPAEANATLNGGGGGAGANGSDGCVIIYETTQPLSTVTTTQLAPLNKDAITYDGWLTTTYEGNPPIGIGSAYNTKKVTHKLRPTTKTVGLLLIGAGGGSSARDGSASWTSTWKAEPTKAYTDKFSVSAGSGGAGHYGTPGEVLSTVQGYLRDGSPSNKYTTGPSANAYNTYGDAAYGYHSPYDVYYHGFTSGCSGAVALVFFGVNYLVGESREINIEVAETGRGHVVNGTPGFAAVFETDIEIIGLVTQNPLLALQQREIAENRITQNPLLLTQKQGLAENRITQNPLLLTQKQGLAENRITQTPMLSLQINDVAPNYVTNSNLVITHSVAPGNVRVTQTVESFLVDSPPIKTRVTQSIASYLVATPDPSINVTASPILALLRHSETVIHLMNFGVLRNPMRHVLYDSDEAFVDGISDYATIQLEGLMPPGSTLFVNDVDVGKTAIVKNGDRVRIRSGILTYYADLITLYAYVTVNDAIRREYAGFWTVVQPKLSPLKRAVIGALSAYNSMLASIGKIARTDMLRKLQYVGSAEVLSEKQYAMLLSGNTAVDVRDGALHSDAQSSVTAQMFSGVEKESTHVDSVAAPTLEKAHDNSINVLLPNPEKIVESAKSTDMPSGIWRHSKRILKDGTSVFGYGGQIRTRHTAMPAPLLAYTLRILSNTSLFVRKPDVQQSAAQQSFFAQPHTTQTAYGLAGAVYGHYHSALRTTKTYDVANRPQSELISSLYVAGRPVSFLYFGEKIDGALWAFYNAAARVAQDYMSGFANSPTGGESNADADYAVNTSYGLYWREMLFGVRSSTATLQSVTYDTSLLNLGSFVVQGFDRAAPHIDLVVTQAISRRSRRVLFASGFGVRGHESLGYRDRVWQHYQQTVLRGVQQSWAKLTYSAETVYNKWNASKAKTTLAHVTYDYARVTIKTRNAEYRLYKDGINRISSAKYYMGFSTKAEVEEFTKNFFMPKLQNKLDGYVYRVGTTDTLVCEVRGANMPIAWLMHGG